MSINYSRNDSDRQEWQKLKCNTIDTTNLIYDTNKSGYKYAILARNVTDPEPKYPIVLPAYDSPPINIANGPEPSTTIDTNDPERYNVIAKQGIQILKQAVYDVQISVKFNKINNPDTVYIVKENNTTYKNEAVASSMSVIAGEIRYMTFSYRQILGEGDLVEPLMINIGGDLNPIEVQNYSVNVYYVSDL